MLLAGIQDLIVFISAEDANLLVTQTLLVIESVLFQLRQLVRANDKVLRELWQGALFFLLLVFGNFLELLLLILEV